MELLVVISIIGILVAIALASYATAQKKSRDSRRISDMKSIQNAWEQYYADNSSSYPVTCDYANPPVAGAISATYLPVGFPIDPKTNTTYDFNIDGASSCTNVSYCFCVGVEIASNGNSQKDCADRAVIAGTGMYCVKNLQ